MSDSPKLSKSRYMNGVQCLKSLYLTCYHPEYKDEQTAYNNYIMETGTRVGILARKRFKHGVLIESDHTEQERAIQETINALGDASIRNIFEAAFVFEDIVVRIDILGKCDDGSLEIIEVKSSTKSKKEHLDDIAIQLYVLRSLGHKVSKCRLMHINPDYVYEGGDYDLESLFRIDDLTEKVEGIVNDVPLRLKNMRDVLSQSEVPKVDVGSHCNRPNRCAFYRHCRRGFSNGHITKLYKIGDKKLNLLRAEDIDHIAEISADFKLTEVQQRIRQCLLDEEMFVAPEAKEKLSDLEFPLFFMDFETSNPALPIFSDSSPWEHIPFLWSVHILNREGTLEHKEFLASDNSDPRKAFADRLIETLGDTGTIVVYYDNFEKGIIDKLAVHLGRGLKNRLLNINDRIFDLYKLVFDHVYHPNFNGSFSIKKVLPALVPELSYDGMDISDGAMALMSYQRFLESSVSKNEKDKILRDLKEYCKLDTLAMVEIYRVLLGLSTTVQQNDLDEEIVNMVTLTAQGMLRKGFSEHDIKVRLRKRFEDEEIEAGIKRIVVAKESKSETASLRRRKQAHFGWYDGPANEDSSHWVALQRHLKNRDTAWTDAMVQSLDSASTSVVSHLAPPQSNDSVLVKGLVLGHIQSGKTANFSAVIAKSVDEGYKLVIILAGMHNNLRMQTEARLRAELVDPQDSKTCTTLTDVDEKGDFKRRQPVSANSQLSRTDGFVLVVLKKNSTVLRNFKRWLDDANEDVLRGCPTLVIDDESDQASINTNKPDQDPTAINNHIRDLLNRFHIVSYVGYTATPFANVFIDASIEEDIYPSDFLVTLEKPESYYGPEELFGRNEVNARESTEGLAVIRTIPEEDAEIIRKMAKGPLVLSDVPDSLKMAIKQFLIGCSVRLCRGQWKEHATMLVHISHLTDAHSKMFSLIESYLDDLKRAIEVNDTSEKEGIEKIWSEDFKETTENITKLPCDYDFDSVWKNIGKFMQSLELIMDNSNSSERLTFDRSLRDGFPFWGIVVGGNTLSRGLTLEGLTCSYFVRASKAYDTLLQMGRWFGYRKGYVDITRIFVPHELYCNFYELATIEQEVRDEISLMAANEERPIDVALRIRKIPNMIITAANKSRATKTTYMSYSGTKIQTHQIITNDKKIIDSNRHAVERLVSGLREGSKPSAVAFSDLSNCFLFQDAPCDDIMQFLDDYYIPKSNSKFIANLVQDYIHEQQERGFLNTWSVALMSLKNGEPITVGGLKVISVSRNVKHEQQDAGGLVESTLRAVSTPGEELIDLADQISAGLVSTDQVLQPESGPRLSDIKARYKYRPHDRALLMIYPLNSNLNINEAEYKSLKKETRPSFPLRAVGQVFAISIVFPYSEKRNGSHLYLQNKAV